MVDGRPTLFSFSNYHRAGFLKKCLHVIKPEPIDLAFREAGVVELEVHAVRNATVVCTLWGQLSYHTTC